MNSCCNCGDYTENEEMALCDECDAADCNARINELNRAIELCISGAQLRALLDQSKRLLASLVFFGSPQMDSNPDLEARKLNDLIVDIEKKL